jgi:AcrR family transcriptional regulator
MTATRDRIIVASNELFRRYGYNGTSLSQISTASGATTGSIYHFFPGGKEDLGVAVIETTGGVYRELFESIAGATSDPSQGILDVFVGAAATLEQTDFIDPCPIGTMAREVANVSEPLRLAASRAFDSWVDAVARHVAAAGVATDNAQSLAELSVTSLEGGFVLSRTRRDAAILGRIGRHVTDVIRAEIAAAGPALQSGFSDLGRTRS